VAGGLHDDVLRAKPRWSRKREQLVLGGIARRVLALGRIGELGAGAEHMAVRVDSACGQLERSALVGPVYQSSQPAVLVKSPEVGLVMARALSRCTSNPAAASGSRILYMSSPSTPAASLSRFSPSKLSRFCGSGQRGHGVGGGHARPRRRHRATITSPGCTSMPAQTIGMLTEPKRGLDGALAADGLAPHRESPCAAAPSHRAHRRR